MTNLERHSYDVVVIGAGGAGLRAAVEAREAGLRVAIICKSLFGKAHTVMTMTIGKFTSATQCAAANS
jgi:succinate dehydrogenase / fumarate reductase flavoprotein subunit